MLPQAWFKRAQLFDYWLKSWFFSKSSGIKAYPKNLEMVCYSLFSKSKCFRPLLYMTSLEELGHPNIHARPGALALECVHTYSLIHDDLPSMDNDDYRRGQLTSHKKFGEAEAILTGDALLTLAFEILSSEPGSLAGKMIRELSKAAGFNGMVAGQLMDIENTGQKGDLGRLIQIHLHKTGALISCSLAMAAIRSHRSESEIDHFRNLGAKMGLMFQVKDDILDVVGHRESFGKTIGKDESQGKLTFPSLLGLEGSKTYLQNLAKEAKETLMELHLKESELQDVISFLEHREK